MAADNTDNPQVRLSHDVVREPLKGDLLVREIPTVSIKKYNRYNTMDLNSTVSSFTPSGTANALMTYLHLETSVGTTEFALADRNGTFDSFLIGTPNAPTNAQNKIVLQGDVMEPIHAIAGSLNVYNLGGSVSDGTYVIAYELVQK